jgi:hypothetical protein
MSRNNTDTETSVLAAAVAAFEARMVSGIISDDVSDDDDVNPSAIIAAVEAARPDISRLPDAIMDGVPVFFAGDRIVIERRASILRGNPYLDTRTYSVKSLDLVTGDMVLWDVSLFQWARDNFITGPKLGQVYKLTNGLSTSPGKKKRGRPRKNLEVAPVVRATDADGNPIKKRRGRPAGVKNRDKAVISVEKAERKALRAAKKAGK